MPPANQIQPGKKWRSMNPFPAVDGFTYFPVMPQTIRINIPAISICRPTLNKISMGGFCFEVYTVPNDQDKSRNKCQHLHRIEMICFAFARGNRKKLSSTPTKPTTSPTIIQRVIFAHLESHTVNIATNKGTKAAMIAARPPADIFQRPGK